MSDENSIFVPVSTANGTAWSRKPTKREMEAAAIEATALANESGILIQQLTSVVNQLLTERKQMDAAVDKFLGQDFEHQDPDFEELEKAEALIHELRKTRLQE